MFALAARYSDPDDLRQLNQDAAMDDNRYVEEAQALLSKTKSVFLHFHRCTHVLSIIDKTFRASRLSTCQALLLLGYGAIGLSMIRLFLFSHRSSQPTSQRRITGCISLSE